VKDHESVITKQLKKRLFEENMLLREKLLARRPLKDKIIGEVVAIIGAFILVMSFGLVVVQFMGPKVNIF